MSYEYYTVGTTSPSARIYHDKNILGGLPCVSGTRIPVAVVLATYAELGVESELLKCFPRLTADDVRACLEYAAELALNEEN